MITWCICFVTLHDEVALNKTTVIYSTWGLTDQWWMQFWAYQDIIGIAMSLVGFWLRRKPEALELMFQTVWKITQYVYPGPDPATTLFVPNNQMRNYNFIIFQCVSCAGGSAESDLAVRWGLQWADPEAQGYPVLIELWDLGLPWDVVKIERHVMCSKRYGIRQFLSRRLRCFFSFVFAKCIYTWSSWLPLVQTSLGNIFHLSCSHAKKKNPTLEIPPPSLKWSFSLSLTAFSKTFIKETGRGGKKCRQGAF